MTHQGTTMATAIEQANQSLRQAVQQRRDAQAAGKPHEDWYDLSQPVTEPRSIDASAEEMQHVPPERPGSLPFLELLEEVRQLHLSKSQDYGSQSDPLANIRQGAEFVGIEPWRGCMVRIADKVQRLRTYCHTGRLVHEGVRDTLMDLSAYSLLAIVLFDEAKDG